MVYFFFFLHHFNRTRCVWSADPYVKVWLHVGDKKVEKRKSMVFKCNLNPVFDEKFEYTLPVEQLREAALEVMVMDFDNIGRNELIGKITISCKCPFGKSGPPLIHTPVPRPQPISSRRQIRVNGTRPVSVTRQSRIKPAFPRRIPPGTNLWLKKNLSNLFRNGTLAKKKSL